MFNHEQIEKIPKDLGLRFLWRQKYQNKGARTIIVEGVIEYKPYSYWLKYRGENHHKNTRRKFEELCQELAEQKQKQKRNRDRRGVLARLKAAAAARRMAGKRNELSKSEIACMNCPRKIDLENGFGYVRRSEDAEPEIKCKECYDKLTRSEQIEYSLFPCSELQKLFKDSDA